MTALTPSLKDERFCFLSNERCLQKPASFEGTVSVAEPHGNIGHQ